MVEVYSLGGHVDFFSDLTLEEVAARISSFCLGEAAFLGKDEYVFDEIPAVRLGQLILGVEVIVAGSPGRAEGYSLEAISPKSLGGTLPDGPEAKAVSGEISRYLGALIAQIPGIDVDSKQWI